MADDVTILGIRRGGTDIKTINLSSNPYVRATLANYSIFNYLFPDLLDLDLDLVSPLLWLLPLAFSPAPPLLRGPKLPGLAARALLLAEKDDDEGEDFLSRSRRNERDRCKRERRQNI